MKKELDNLNLPFMAKSAGPPWLPAPAAEAREIAWWTQWLLGLLGMCYIIAGIVSFFTMGSFWGAFLAGYTLAAGVAYFVVLVLMKSTFFDNLDLGKFKEAADRLLVWMLIALILGIVPGLLLLFAYFRLRDVFQPNYQPYPTGAYQAGQAPPPPPQPQYAPPPQPQQAPPHQAPPAQPAPEHPKHADMVKCKKCGVQYPSFMRTCPNCNEPR